MFSGVQTTQIFWELYRDRIHLAFLASLLLSHCTDRCSMHLHFAAIIGMHG
jgi:hypothetical protein